MNLTRALLNLSLLQVALLYVVTGEYIVTTNNGKVKGKLVTEDADGTEVAYVSYQGIPYAKPPIGDLRFKDPELPEEWNGVLEASTAGPVCPQIADEFTEEQMSEDCLTLNIYVPAKIELPMPVMFWVHGGQFKSGGSRAFGPKFLMQKQVIVVTTNYRLGALGFLSVPNSREAVGNAGLKDILMSLKWVKNNIASFGGDPSRITANGQSAGSVSINYLLLSPETDNLLHNVILSSGAAIGYRFLTNDTLAHAMALAYELGYTENPQDEQRVIKFLRTKLAADIVKAQENMGRNEKIGFRPFTPFVPSIEDASVSDNPLIIDYPLSETVRGIRQNIPILAGVTAQEGIVHLPFFQNNPGLIDEIDNDFERCIPTDIGRTLNDEQKSELAAKIKQFYFGDNEFTLKTLPDYFNLVMDTMYLRGVDHTLRIHTSRNDAKQVFYYVFDFDGALNYGKLIKNMTDYPGTSHCDEVGYHWDTQFTRNISLSDDSPSKLMRERVLELWTNFVKYSDPTFINTTTMPVKWHPIQYPSINYLNLGVDPKMMVNPFRNRTKFWDDLYVI